MKRETRDAENSNFLNLIYKCIHKYRKILNKTNVKGNFYRQFGEIKKVITD